MAARSLIRMLALLVLTATAMLSVLGWPPDRAEDAGAHYYPWYWDEAGFPPKIKNNTAN